MKLKEKKEAVILRSQGFSIKEITKLTRVAQSTISLWVRDVELDDIARARLQSRISAGQLAAADKKKAKTEILNTNLRSNATGFIRLASVSQDAERIICSLIYWCEGVKNYKNGIAFTNSDPALTRLFISLLVSKFDATPSRISCRLHLHEYHNEVAQKKFWSSAIKLPESQFEKTYWKPHTGKRYRDGYPGCISVRYYDNILSRKVMYVAQEFIKKMGA